MDECNTTTFPFEFDTSQDSNGGPDQLESRNNFSVSVAAIDAEFKNGSGRRGQPLYFDIETVPDLSRMHLFDLPPLPEVVQETAHGACPAFADFIKLSIPQIGAELTRLNPEESWLAELACVEQQQVKPRMGVHEAIRDARKAKLARGAAEGQQRKKMATSPEMCRIVALGWGIGDGEINSTVVAHDANPNHLDAAESEVLQCFWDLAARCSPVIGYNVAGFDLLAIYVRSALLKIPQSRHAMDRKAWGKDVIDLMQVRFPRLDGNTLGLKTLAKLYGIAVPAGDTDGSNVADLWENDPEALGRYVRSDVEISREVHRFYAGYFTP